MKRMMKYAAIAILFVGVYYSTPTLIQRIDGEATYDLFGSALSFGNFSNDSWGDVLVGAPEANTNCGEAYIYYGANPFNTTVDKTLDDSGLYDEFGKALAGHSDYNGDGYTDAAIGAPGYSSSTGHVLIYYGGSPMNETYDVTLSGASTGDNYGSSINNGKANFNRDSYDDIAVGAPGYSSSQGRVYIYWGGSPMNTTVDVTINGASAGDEFGYAIACAEVTGDDTVDLIVGAPGYSSDQGKVYIYKGSRQTGTDCWTLWKSYTGESAGDRFGSSVFARFNYVVVGAPGRNSEQGKVYLYKSFGASADITKTGESSYDEFGASVWIGNTYNMYDREYNEFVVGAPGRNSQTGKVYSYKTEDGTQLWTMNGGSTYDQYGYAIMGGKDVDGSVTVEDDLAIGAPGRYDIGSVYVYNNDHSGDGDGSSVVKGIRQTSSSNKISVRSQITVRGNFEFQLPRTDEKYKLAIFDVIGCTVREFEGISCNKIERQQLNSFKNSGDQLGAGIYFYKIETGDQIYTGKVTICK